MQFSRIDEWLIERVYQPQVSSIVCGEEYCMQMYSIVCGLRQMGEGMLVSSMAWLECIRIFLPILIILI